jgi:hypothetical protein
VSLRTSLGWFSQIATNGRLAVDKLSGESDPRHPSNQRHLGDLSGFSQMEESNISGSRTSSPVPFGSLGTEMFQSTLSVARNDAGADDEIYNW